MESIGVRVVSMSIKSGDWTQSKPIVKIKQSQQHFGQYPTKAIAICTLGKLCNWEEEQENKAATLI